MTGDKQSFAAGEPYPRPARNTGGLGLLIGEKLEFERQILLSDMS